MKLTLFSILIFILVLASGFQVFGQEWTQEQKEAWITVEAHIIIVGLRQVEIPLKLCLPLFWQKNFLSEI